MVSESSMTTMNEMMNREIGVKIKKLRQSQSMTLKETATKAQVSESFLSQVERGKTSPSLATFLRIASALGKPLGHFFEGSAPPGKIVKASLYPHLEHPDGWEDYIVSPPSATTLHIVHSVIPPGSGSGHELYVHDAEEEIVYLLEGSLEVFADGEAHPLDVGDTLVINPRQPHGFANNSASVTRVLWIMGKGAY